MEPDEAQFFAHYDVLTQRPPTGNRLEPVDYLFMEDRVGARLNNPNLKDFSQRGPVTPDYVIHIKPKPLILNIKNERKTTNRKPLD